MGTGKVKIITRECHIQVNGTHLEIFLVFSQVVFCLWVISVLFGPVPPMFIPGTGAGSGRQFTRTGARACWERRGTGLTLGEHGCWETNAELWPQMGRAHRTGQVWIERLEIWARLGRVEPGGQSIWLLLHEGNTWECWLRSQIFSRTEKKN